MKKASLLVAAVVLCIGAQLAAFVISGGDVDLFGSVVLGVLRLFS